MTCQVCGEQAVVTDSVSGVPHPTGVTVDGFVTQSLTPDIRYWKHHDGSFCSQAETAVLV